MIHRFDHAVLAVRNLAEASAGQAEALGLLVSPGGVHPGAGTHNSLIRFGVDYLELLAVRDPVEAAQGRRGWSSLLAFLEKREGWVGFALASDDIEADAERAAVAGLDVVGPIPMQRQRPDGRVLSWRLAYPTGHPWRQPLPFLIQWDQPDAERLAWEPRAAHPLGATRVASVAVAVRNLDAARRLCENGLRLGGSRVESVPELAARRATLGLEGFQIHLLAPASDDSPLAVELATVGEGPFEVTLAVSSLEHARAHLAERGTAITPAPGAPNGFLVAPGRTHDARIVLVAERQG